MSWRDVFVHHHTHKSFQPCVRGAQGGEASLQTTHNCNSSHQTVKLSCGNAAMAWHEIHAVTPRLLWKSEVISPVDSPQRGGTGHLITANRLSQGWWSKIGANHLDPHQYKRLFPVLSITNALLLLFPITLCSLYITWTVQRAHKTSVNDLYAFLIMPLCVQTA